MDSGNYYGYAVFEDFDEPHGTQTIDVLDPVLVSCQTRSVLGVILSSRPSSTFTSGGGESETLRIQTLQGPHLFRGRLQDEGSNRTPSKST